MRRRTKRKRRSPLPRRQSLLPRQRPTAASRRPRALIRPRLLPPKARRRLPPPMLSRDPLAAPRARKTHAPPLAPERDLMRINRLGMSKETVIAGLVRARNAGGDSSALSTVYSLGFSIVLGPSRTVIVDLLRPCQSHLILLWDVKAICSAPHYHNCDEMTCQSPRSTIKPRDLRNLLPSKKVNSGRSSYPACAERGSARDSSYSLITAGKANVLSLPLKIVAEVRDLQPD